MLKKSGEGSAGLVGYRGMLIRQIAVGGSDIDVQRTGAPTCGGEAKPPSIKLASSSEELHETAGVYE